MIIEIKETLETSFSIRGTKSAGGKDMVNHSATKGYRAVVKRGPNETVPFDLVTEAHIACDARLPVVNRSTWFSARTGRSMPYAVCRSKDVNRDSNNGHIFYITCNFETGPIETEQCTATPPSSADDLSPEVSIEVGSYERVLFQDKDGKQCWRLPGTNSPFQNPIVETIPTLSLTITQFEPFVTYEQILERSFKVNSATYRTKDPGMWMIGAVKVTEQDVTLANNSVATFAKVTYPIVLSERYFYEPGVAASLANRTYYGHKQVQPLVDSFEVHPVDEDIIPLTDPNSGNITTGYIYRGDEGGGVLAGEQRFVVAGSNDDRPDYMQFRTQDEIDFTTFLKA